MDYDLEHHHCCGRECFYRHETGDSVHQEEARVSRDIIDDSSTSRKVKFNDHGSNLIDGLKKLRETNEFADLRLKVNSSRGEDTILVHGCVLAAHSPFVAAVQRNMGNKAVDLKQWNRETIICLVDWMYEGVLEIKARNCYELLESSDYLCLDKVSEECINFICSHLDFENCCEAYRISGRHHSEEFKSKVKKFFLTNICRLLKGKQLTRLPRDDLLMILKDDNLVIVDESNFPMSCEDEEMRLFDLLNKYIEGNKAYELWHFILKDVLRFGSMRDSDIKQISQSAPKGCLAKCTDKDVCIQFLESVCRLKSLQADMSGNNPLWTKPRNVTKAIHYAKTKRVADTLSLRDENPPLPFDDVTSILEELLSNKKRPHLYVTGMKLFIRNWLSHSVIGGIQVTYNVGKTFTHGDELPAAEVHEFVLMPGERIVNIKGQTGWLVDQLAFETSCGKKHGPYGGDGGGARDFRPPKPGSYLVGVQGQVATSQEKTYLRHLQFIWGSFDSKLMT